MKRTILMAALAGAALITAGPSLGQGRGGGHGGGPGHKAGAGVGVGAGAGGHGGRVDVRTDARVDGRVRREEARSNSQGPSHASARARSRANANSVIAGSSAVTLGTLRTGMAVRDTNGVAIGTVRRVLRTGNGSVSNVLVASADGRRTIPLAPSTLSVSGDVVTTTRLATSRRRR